MIKSQIDYSIIKLFSEYNCLMELWLFLFLLSSIFPSLFDFLLKSASEWS